MYRDEIAKTNISVIWYETVDFWEYNEDEYRAMMESLIQKDPRVIIVNGNSGIFKACWFHRYKMYGPNYVFLFLTNSEFGVYQKIPDQVSDWCTPAMVAEVLKSSFVYGESIKQESYGFGTDSVGYTYGEWLSDLKSLMHSPETHFNWDYARLMSHELSVYSGFFIDGVEKVLNAENDTLGNWHVGSENFQRNPKKLIKVFEDVIYSIRVEGLKGSYEFERKTKRNSKGFCPSSIFRMTLDVRSATVSSKVFGVYESMREPGNRLQHLNTDFKWATPDGKPPFDKVKISKTRLETVSLIGAIILWGKFSSLLFLN